MASAVPLYQFSSMRCCGGKTSIYSSKARGRKFQPALMWRDRLCALYWVSTRIRRRSLLMQLDKVKSIMRYNPPKGTAGLARSRVKGSRRVPLPPARINVNTSLTNEISRVRRPFRAASLISNVSSPTGLDEAMHGKMLTYTLPTGLAHSSSSLGTAEQEACLSSQCRFVGRLDQKTGRAVHN